MDRFEKEKYVRQVLAILAACGALFSSGLNFAWPSSCLKPILDEYQINNRTGSYITVIGPFGNVVGSGLSLVLLQFIGSKFAILCSVISHCVSWSFMAFLPPPWQMYMIGRVCLGLSESICNIATPSYISEIACPKMKKEFLCLMPIILISGNCVVNAIGLEFSVKTTSVVCMTIVIFWSTFNFISPSTPYYFIKKNDYENALKSLKFYHGKAMVESDFTFVTEDIEKQKLYPNSMIHLFTVQSNRQAILMMSLMRITHLLSGYPATITYSHQIFIRAHVNIPENFAVGAYIMLHLIFSILGIFLNLTSKRKKNYIISCIGSFVFQFSVMTYFYYDEISNINVERFRWTALLAMAGYICFYSIGMHVIPNLMFMDLFRDSIKSKACCFLNIVQGIMFFIITKLFQEVTDIFGQFCIFLIFTIGAFFAIFFVHFCVPETQGKTCDEIELMFEKNEFRFIFDSLYRY